MSAQIEIFCQKYNIAAKQVYNIQLLLEELITEIFKQCYETLQPEIEFSIECSDENNEISIYLFYVSDNFNPLKNTGKTVDSLENDIDNLGMLLVRKISKECAHIFENGKNKFTINF